MNVVSAFDGHCTGQLALTMQRFKIDNYFASEIDKSAIIIAKKNFPNTKHVGSITDIKGSQFPKIDLYIGGSPCQSFSRGGDGSGFDGKSKLFWEYVRVLEELRSINPSILFFLENVVMKKEWENVITEAMGVEPISIDSKNTSAQKRQRLYWTNIPNIEQPKDQNITLLDIVKGEREIISDHPLVISKDEGVFKIKNATKQGYLYASEGDSVNLEVPNSKTRRGRVGKGKTNTLNTACNYGMIYGSELVKLSISDFEALQNLPIDYTEGVSLNQRKKMIGNGWTAGVVAHIFSKIPQM